MSPPAAGFGAEGRGLCFTTEGLQGPGECGWVSIRHSPPHAPLTALQVMLTPCGVMADCQAYNPFTPSQHTMLSNTMHTKQIHCTAGDADAYGVIADCFTDLGEFEKAAEFYDKYIEAMNRGS